MKFTHDYREDFQQIIKQWTDGKPFALSRFADGERAVLDAHQIITDSYRVPTQKNHPFAVMLRESLVYRGDEYHVGITTPCCSEQVSAALLADIGEPYDHVTFANIFCNANYHEWLRFILNGKRRYVIVSGGFGNYRVPQDIPNANWDMDGLVDQLLNEDRSILVAAGPAAGIIIMKYWQKQDRDRRQVIVDVGTTLDPWIWAGKVKRGYQCGGKTREHICRWTK